MDLCPLLSQLTRQFAAQPFCVGGAGAHGFIQPAGR